MKILFIGAGGFTGAIIRYLLIKFIYKFSNDFIFPFAILIINVSGCFLIGLLSGLIDEKNIFSPEIRSFLIIGFLGGFTTYSTFGFETFDLVQSGNFFLSMLNIMLHIVLGMAAVFVGNSLSKMF